MADDAVYDLDLYNFSYQEGCDRLGNPDGGALRPTAQTRTLPWLDSLTIEYHGDPQRRLDTIATNHFIETATDLGVPGLSHELGREANFRLYEIWLQSQ